IRHLLICPGLDRERYEQQFKSRVSEDFPVLTDWMGEGVVRLSDDKKYLTLTEEGMELSDCLGPKLISSDIRKRMQEWEAVYGQTDDLV
ncbi:MAG TPA: radical SAM protein, partial [Lachnospiraceae bacterium]|nr:radical SAM protein [Lachnospiraceae bacterium]